jgi:cytochrome c oxidase subunit 2
LPLSDLEVKALIAFIKEKGQQQDSAVEKTLKGAELVQAKGCLACHSQDGSKMLGPSWKGLFGQRRTLNSGQTIVVDEAYLRESIFQPNAKIVAGYPAVMPPPMLSQEEAQAIVELIKTL